MQPRVGAASALKAASEQDSEQSADLPSKLAALEAENARLKSMLGSGKGVPALSGSTVQPTQGGTGSVFPGQSAVSTEPPRSFGQMKLWVGTWNMGAVDPFQDMNIRANAAEVTKALSPFIPLGYDVYVLGVQEGVSDKVFEAVEAHTSTFRLPLNAKLYPARDVNANGETRLRSRRMGRAIKAQTFLDEAKAGHVPEPVVSTADMLDRVWGRGDGALMTPKYTGIAVFMAPAVAPYVRLLGMYKHSFGASEGSKGGVGVALGLYNVTMAFINAHMASKRADMRRMQYGELVDRLGSKLGGRGFGVNESFHHVVWMGDLNVHCKGVSAKDALALVRTGRHVQLLLQHDELLVEKEEGTVFHEYEEPLMAPRFFPTYKKLPARGVVDTTANDWVSRVYVTAYKEPFYKGGRVAERVPSWTDRVQYHSLPDRWGELLPQPLDPEHPDTSPHNYQAVNDGLDCSDHSPVFATFNLEICADETDEIAEAIVEAEQAQQGYGAVEEGTHAGDGAPSARSASIPSGVMADADFSSLHPAMRPLVVLLRLNNIVVDWGGMSIVPRAVSVVFPLPYEDSNEIPERSKVVRASMLSFSRGSGDESIGAATRIIVSQARKLESLHLLLKVSLDQTTKAQCVLAMRDGGFVGVGSHMNTFLLPLTRSGVPLTAGGRQANVQFVMEMTAYERGGVQTVTPPTAGVAGQSGPVTYQSHLPGGPSAQRRGTLPVPASEVAARTDSASVSGVRRGSVESARGSEAGSVEAARAVAPQANVGFKSAKAPTIAKLGTPSRPAPAAPIPPKAPSVSSTPSATPGMSTGPTVALGTPGGTSTGPSPFVAASSAPTPGGVNSDLARAKAQQMMAAARFKAAAAAQATGGNRPPQSANSLAVAAFALKAKSAGASNASAFSNDENSGSGSRPVGVPVVVSDDE